MMMSNNIGNNNQSNLLKLGRDLVPSHPAMLYLVYSTAVISFKLDSFKEAIKHCNLLIAKDSHYKFAYDLKGQALAQLGKNIKAIECFDKALEVDGGYADAMIHKVETLKKMVVIEASKEATTEDVSEASVIKLKQRLSDTLEEAKHLTPSAYDAQMKQVSDDDDDEVKLPEQTFQAGDRAYMQELDLMKKDLVEKELLIKKHFAEQKLDIQTLREDNVLLKEELAAVKKRVDSLYLFTVDLDEQLSSISESLERQTEEALSLKDMKELSAILAQREWLEELSGHVTEFNRNADVRDFFGALLTELNANFIAALSVYSGKVAEDKGSTYSDAAQFFGSSIELIPVVGQFASKLLPQFAFCLDTVENFNSKESFSRMLNLTHSFNEFEQISLTLAVKITLKHQEALVSLQGAEVPNDWKTKLTALCAKDIEGIIVGFMSRNNTQAKLLGRNKAHEIIVILGQEGVADKLSLEKATGEGSVAYRAKAEVVARALLDQLQEIESQTSSTSTDDGVPDCFNFNFC